MNSRIPLSIPNLGKDERAAVTRAIESGWVSYLGPEVKTFESALANECQALDAAAVVSGTAALHVALVVAGIGVEEEVIMPALSFVAPANALRYTGAFPVFIDSCEDDWQADVKKARQFLECGCSRDKSHALRNRETGRRVTALLPVHILGGMADLDAWVDLAVEFDLWLIEDAAEAMGAQYKGRGIGAPVGNKVDMKRMVCTSFNGNKVMTTGGGGAILANHPPLIERARHLSSTAKTDLIEFVHDDVGFNYRMNNIAAAIGLTQLKRLPEFLERKQEIANYYESMLPQTRIQRPPRQENVDGTYWLYTIRIREGSRPLLQKLIEKGIEARPIWQPLCEQTPYKQDFIVESTQIAQTLWTECLSIPCSTGMTNEGIEYVTSTICELV